MVPKLALAGTLAFVILHAVNAVNVTGEEVYQAFGHGTYENAWKKCEDYHATLPCVHNQTVNDLVQEAILATVNVSYSGEGYPYAWLNYSDTNHDDMFVWGDGIESNFTNWARGFPLNVSGNATRCVTMGRDSGEWRTDKCNELYPAIICYAYQCTNEFDNVAHSTGYTHHGKEYNFPTGRSTPDCVAGFLSSGAFVCEKNKGFVDHGAACTLNEEYCPEINSTADRYVVGEYERSLGSFALIECGAGFEMSPDGPTQITLECVVEGQRFGKWHPDPETTCSEVVGTSTLDIVAAIIFAIALIIVFATFTWLLWKQKDGSRQSVGGDGGGEVDDGVESDGGSGFNGGDDTPRQDEHKPLLNSVKGLPTVEMKDDTFKLFDLGNSITGRDYEIPLRSNQTVDEMNTVRPGK